MIKFDVIKDKWVVDEEWNIRFKEVMQQWNKVLNETLADIKKIKMENRYKLINDYHYLETPKGCRRVIPAETSFEFDNSEGQYRALIDKRYYYADVDIVENSGLFELIEEKKPSILIEVSPTEFWGNNDIIGKAPVDIKRGDEVIVVFTAQKEKPISNAQKFTNEIKGEKPKTERVTLKDTGTFRKEEKERITLSYNGPMELKKNSVEPFSDKEFDLCEKALNGELVELITLKMPFEEMPKYDTIQKDFEFKGGVDVKGNQPTIDNGTKKYTQREVIELFSGFLQQGQCRFGTLPNEFDLMHEEMHTQAVIKSFKEFLKDK